MQIGVNTKSLVSHKPPDSPEGRLVDQLVEVSGLPDGYVAQLKTDLTAFPLNWLQRFKEQDVSVTALNDNQTLADTPLLRNLDETAIQSIVDGAQPMIQAALQEVMEPLQSIEDEGERAYRQRGAADELKERLWQAADKSELGFAVEVGRDPLDLTYLAQTAGFDEEYDSEAFSRWKQAFREINAGLCKFEGDQVIPQHGFRVTPYLSYRGKNVRAITLPDYKQVTGIQYSNNLGGTWQVQRVVLLHDSVLPNPSVRTGHHRTSLHEMGHMLDYICREIPQTKETHEAKVVELFELGLKRAAEGKVNPFLTDRADDMPSEMMAEAVEAYLTVPEDEKSNNFYKAVNHREALQERFPELYDYVDYLITKV